ncbi:MAG: hypothetical protein L0312_02265 [Acidobacteria bacterium]|nr:hypothetical protein [Acidobacteriota bacterium]
MTVGQASAPFLGLKSFIVEESEAQEPEIRTSLAVRSPFISVYELADGESAFDDPIREAYSSIVHELYDEEFDEALFELLTNARNMHQDHLASGYPSTEADRIVTQHFSQLVRESEAMVDAMAREFGSRDKTGIVESEIESFFERYSPSVLRSWGFPRRSQWNRRRTQPATHPAPAAMRQYLRKVWGRQCRLPLTVI